MKRSIGHLCHDEPKEGSKGKGETLINGPPSASAALQSTLFNPTLHDAQNQFLEEKGLDVGLDGMAPADQPNLSVPDESTQPQIMDGTNEQRRLTALSDLTLLTL